MDGVKERLKMLKNLAEIMGKKKEQYAELMANEMGKVLKEGIGEIDKCIKHTNYYIENSI